jgi:hypothetical protein
VERLAPEFAFGCWWGKKRRINERGTLRRGESEGWGVLTCFSFEDRDEAEERNRCDGGAPNVFKQQPGL